MNPSDPEHSSPDFNNCAGGDGGETPDRQDVWVERLCQGRLSPAERTQYLRSLDTLKTGWRDLALALVEERVIGHAYTDFEQTGLSAGDWEADDNRSERGVAPAARATSNGDSGGHRRRAPGSMSLPAIRWFGLAASLALVGFLGFGLGRQDGHQTAPPNLTSSPTFPATDGRGAGDFGGPEVDDEASEYRGHRLQLGNRGKAIPLLDPNQLVSQRVSENSFNVTPEMRHALYQSGYRIEPETRYVSGQTPDGDAIIVPIHGLNFRSVFQ